MLVFPRSIDLIMLALVYIFIYLRQTHKENLHISNVKINVYELSVVGVQISEHTLF